MKKLTPAMQQYVDMKKQHPDCVLFFRLGDFYEMFREDAKIAAKILDLTLTSKNKKAPNPIPMAGIPYHSAEKYIQKMIDAGYKVAVAEQTSTPIPGQIVQREVVSIITPGTYINETIPTINNMVAITSSPHMEGNNIHITRGDLTLGKRYTKTFPTIHESIQYLMILQPQEIIMTPDFLYTQDIKLLAQQGLQSVTSLYDIPQDPIHFLSKICNVQTLEGFGKALTEGREFAAALLLAYIQYTQKEQTPHVLTIQFHQNKTHVLLDNTTIKNLEIFQSSYNANQSQSLRGVIDNTASRLGSRLLHQRLQEPIKSITTVHQRHRHIKQYIQDPQTHNIHTALQQVTDIPRLTATILYRKTLPSLFIKLRQNLQHIFHHTALHLHCLNIGLEQDVYDHIQQLLEQLESILKEEISDDTINYIQDGVSSAIDEKRRIAYHSDELLIQYQQHLIQHSGIKNIKIKYINKTGYLIEINQKDVQQREERANREDKKHDFIRRQTLKTTQRYVTPYLETLQQEILQAKDQLIALEQTFLQDLRTQLLNNAANIGILADAIAQIDIYSAHALFTIQHRWTEPSIQTQNTQTEIIGGRHPVIEAFLNKNDHFIPNNLSIGEQEGLTHIITGPNMGGKSTFLRQNALILLLAHCGLYVPATSATIRPVDGIFARVGSGDALAKNQSTFMTEMIEVANILHNATEQSFIIFDELGRGTSTYDGLALSTAVIQYVTQHIKAQTLVATHYHELIQLPQQIPAIKNYSVSVYETEKEVVFMKKIVAGGASRSYGIEVAKLAGIPSHITQQAEHYLTELETSKSTTQSTLSPHQAPSLLPIDNKIHTPTPDPQWSKIKSLLSQYDINNITPLQALQLLAKIKEDI